MGIAGTEVEEKKMRETQASVAEFRWLPEDVFLNVISYVLETEVSDGLDWDEYLHQLGALTELWPLLMLEEEAVGTVYNHIVCACEWEGMHWRGARRYNFTELL